MIRTYSAQLVEYNANDRGNYAPDCVKRALSMAFSVPYGEIAKELRAAQKKHNQEHHTHYEWNQSPVYEHVIRAHGGSEKQKTDSPGQTLAEFADTHSGTYLVTTGRTSNSSNHIVCVIDGEVFDSWDSLDQKVVAFYKVEGEHKPKSGIKDRFPELIAYAIELVDRTVQFRLKKFKLDDVFDHEDTTESVRGFAFQIHCYLQSTEFEDYLAEIAITYALSPTTTYDEAIEYINKITSTRVYDRLYAVRDRVKELREAREYEAGGELPERAGHVFITNGQENRFYRSLPEWVKRRLTYLNVYEPGQYSNSYSISFIPLPGDPDSSDVELEGYTSDEVKDRIKRYKNNDFDREWYEYY